MDVLYKGFGTPAATEAFALGGACAAGDGAGRSLEQDGEGDPKRAHTDEQEHVGALDAGEITFQLVHVGSSRTERQQEHRASRSPVEGA